MPWFVNWDDYKTTFEHEAGRILGHPVHVIGSAKASILPSPSLTFTDVQVGQPNAPPMMTVDRFEVTIELMPLLQGQIRVVAMRLDRPVVRMSVDENGVLDWLRRSTDAETLDPDKVVLAAATIDEGTVAYSDASTGVALQFSGITASVEARSLAGPWRADGSYRDGDTAVPFHLATGRRLDDGTIRLKVDASPPRWPVDVSADGVIGQDPASGLTYAGTYKATELVENVTGDVAPAGEDAGPTGWRSEGAFTLSGGSLAIDKAVLSNGPADRPSSLAGALTINFGNTPSFSATAEARQLDLDRTLGGGPNQPIEVPVAAERLVAWLNSLPIPHVPGRIAFNVPAVVVGGSVIQDVAFTAVPAAAGWEIGGFRARLPGQATVVADGVLTTDRQVGFVGTARLAVQQPATFASWWRGQSSQGVGRQLAAFDISGKTEIAPGRISVDNIDARIGDATITGRFAWSEAQRDHHRHLGTDLKADRIDFVQVKALAELLVGRDLAAAGVLADSYSVRLAAGAFQFDDINVNDVAVDAAYADDVLTVVQLVAGDLGGASFRVTSGRIDDLTTNPRGHLDARLEATTVDGLALIAGKFFPDSGLFQWLGRSADAITPAYLDAHIIAPPKAGASGLSVVLDGVAGLTTLNVQLQSNAHRPAEWRSEPASLSVVLDSPDSAGLARQIGLAATGADGDSGAHVEIDGDGVPADGLKTTIIAEIAGLTTNASGKLTFASGLVPAFAGSFGVSAFDLGSIIATAGLAVPGAMHDTAIDLDGTISAGAGEADLEWKNGQVGGRAVSGRVKVARGADQGWRIDGDLAVDRVDLGWLMALGLGAPPLPTGDRAAPWSKAPFTPPGYGPVSGKLKVATEHLRVSDALDIANAELALALQPQRIDVDVTGGHVAGGVASGGVSIHNVDGNANLTGQFNLAGATLESFIWKLDQRAVATGIFDLSANFEATGRSPAGLVSSMTGGGVVAVRDGEARYLNPNAARLVIRASDLGQEFTEDALRMTLADQIDADTLRFGDAGGAFSIAAGTLRLKNLSARSDKLAAAGNAVLDLNAMTLDSDWTLTFDAGDNKVEGTDPKVGIIFRGPIAAPSRIIDPLPFSSYLNTRREARILEIIAMEEADRAERERLSRLSLKLRQDRERSERLAREAAEAEQRRREIATVTAQKLERLHVEREIATDERAALALKRAAERAMAESLAAQAAAEAASRHAAAERARADQLAAALPGLVASDKQAAAVTDFAARQLVAVQATAAAAGEEAARARAAADEAEAAALAAMDEAKARKAAAEETGRQRSAAELALHGATTAAAGAKSTADAAEVDAAAAEAALDTAGNALAEAFRERDKAVDSLTAAEAALAETEASAQTSGASKTAAAQEARETAAEKARLQATANVAAGLASEAVKSRDDARRALAEAEAALAAAETTLATATTTATAAAGVAEAMAAGQGADEQAIADSNNANATALAAQIQQAARKADADRARQVMEMARAEYEAAETAASAAASRATAAQAAVEAAIAAAARAATAAEQAVAGNAAALNALSERTAARDAAAREAADREKAAQEAGAAFDDAQARARETADQAASAKAAAEAAETAQSSAAAAVTAAASAADAAAFAAQSAVAVRERAAGEATLARSRADAAVENAAAAQAVLAEKSTVNDAALAAGNAARTARMQAEEAASAAAQSAAQAEGAAADAARLAREKAAAAEAAAGRSPLEKSETVAVPTPKPRRQPINLVPDALAGDQPLVIVPPQP